mgnify:CR=1 FL=1
MKNAVPFAKRECKKESGNELATDISGNFIFSRRKFSFDRNTVFRLLINQILLSVILQIMLEALLKHLI